MTCVHPDTLGLTRTAPARTSLAERHVATVTITACCWEGTTRQRQMEKVKHPLTQTDTDLVMPAEALMLSRMEPKAFVSPHS